MALLLLVILSIPLTLQAFHPGFFVYDDGEWMIIRSSAFHEALRDGQFPVRYLGRLLYGYGYSVPTFLYPGYLYLVEPLYLFGIGYIDAIKIFFTITMVSSGLFTYFWLTKLFHKWSALAGALVYLYTPYHLVDMYRRGSLGELLALTVIPFILWQIERKSLFFSSVGIAFLILSHNIMAALFLPVILIYSLLRHSKTIKQNMRHTIFLLLFGLGLSAFFWIPALFELQFTVFSQTKMFDWRNYFALYPIIGGVQLVLIITGIWLVIYQLKEKFITREKTDHAYTSLLVFFVLIGVLSVYFSSSYSSIFWEILPVTFLQFPFRFLSLEIVAVSFLAAYILYRMHNKVIQIIWLICICTALAINAQPYTLNIPYYNKGDNFYTSNVGSTTSGDEYTPVWVKEKPLIPATSLIEFKKGEGTAANVVSNNKVISFEAKIQKDALVTINKIYWPGWQATIDGTPTKITYDNPNGVMSVSVPKGIHSIEFTFVETPLRLAADWVSLITIAVLIVVSTINVRKGSKKKKT